MNRDDTCVRTQCPKQKADNSSKNFFSVCMDVVIQIILAVSNGRLSDRT